MKELAQAREIGALAFENDTKHVTACSSQKRSRCRRLFKAERPQPIATVGDLKPTARAGAAQRGP
jgi:hypothetical protein